MKQARWRDRCNASWPAHLVEWLRMPGSLTLALQRVHGPVRVEVRYQGMGHVLKDETSTLIATGLRGSSAVAGSVPSRVRVRQVTLVAGGAPRVVAHSVVRWLGPQSDWPFWRQLGARSLGSVLFRDRRVKRSALQFAVLSPRHPLAQQAAQAQQRSSTERCYARRAVYRRASGRTPLVVTEVFLCPQTVSGHASIHP